MSADHDAVYYTISFFSAIVMKIVKKSKPTRPKRREPRISTEHEIWKSKASAGSFPSGLTKKLQDKYGIPLPFITDTQWDEIQRLTGLSHSARFEINIALRRYWHHRMQAVDPKIVDQVLSAREALGAAVDALLPIMIAEDELYKGRIIHFEQSAAEQHLQLERCLDTLSRTEQLLSRIQNRLERSKRPGKPGFGPLYELVHHLDYVLYNFFNINITRSGNKMSPMGSGSSLDFVVAVLQIADLTVKRSTIEKIVAKYVTDRKRQKLEFGSYPRA